MLRKPLLVAVAAACVASYALAGGYSARTHLYAVEYLKPVAGMGDLTTLNVTFNRRMDAQTAERVLRDELQRVITLFPPKGEVMAWAWSETESAPGSEDMIPLVDGSQYLIHSPQTKTIETEKQHKQKAKR